MVRELVDKKIEEWDKIQPNTRTCLLLSFSMYLLLKEDLDVSTDELFEYKGMTIFYNHDEEKEDYIQIM